jgi:hypothetical protein
MLPEQACVEKVVLQKASGSYGQRVQASAYYSLLVYAALSY